MASYYLIYILCDNYQSNELNDLLKYLVVNDIQLNIDDDSLAVSIESDGRVAWSNIGELLFPVFALSFWCFADLNELYYNKITSIYTPS
jgi:hypothetical protein